MIGIFGSYRRDRAQPVDLAPMAMAIPETLDRHAPRGIGAAVGLAGHRHGVGHSAAERGALKCVAVGEVFNLAIVASGLPECTTSSLATVLLALAKEEALDRLAEANGSFAAALYDGQAHRLTLLTDRLATYPIHIWHHDGDMVFASQLAAMLGDARIPRKADPDALAQLFTMQRTVGETSPIAGIKALPAGCIWHIDPDGCGSRQYWRLAWRGRDFGMKEGARALADAFRNALERQTMGTRNGLLLSGGVDSRMVLAAAPRGALSCWTTASYEQNPELALAGRIAETFGVARQPLVVAPGDTLSVLDRTVVESNGMYPASTPMSAFLPTVGRNCDTVLTGHGIDYTLRGYYLPARFVTLFGSRTRWPSLRKVARRPTGGDVLTNLRQGPPKSTLDRIVCAARRAFWWQSQARAMDAALGPWLDEGNPVNAWDAFILHAVSKHYAFTSMMSVRAVANLRIPAFDAEVFDIYLRMPPAWRCSGRMVQLALRKLSPEAARLPNANTHFPADREPRLEVLGLLGRGVLRRLGLAGRPVTPSAMHSAGSWQNLAALMREDPGHRRLFTEIRGRLDALCFGLLDPDGLADCIDEHLDGRADHTKLLRQLMTHDAWVRCFGITGIG